MRGTTRQRLNWRRWIEYHLTRALLRFIGRSSWRVVYRVANLVGDLTYYLVASRRQNSLAGLNIAFNGQYSDRKLAALARSASRNFFKSRFEFLRLPFMSREELLGKTTVRGSEYLAAALSRNRGALLLSPHLGSWEVMGARLAADGFPITVIARPQNNKRVSNLFVDIQVQSGMKVISKFNSVRATLRALRDEEAVGILPDQHAGPTGLMIDFFGRRTPMHAVVPLVALRTGAAVLPCLAVRDAEDRINVTIHPPLQLIQTGKLEEDLRTNTELITRLFEGFIREYPDQWLWMHRRWRPSDLELDDCNNHKNPTH